MRASTSRRSERGSVLVIALVLVAVLLVAGIAIIRIAGNDRTDAAKMGGRERAQICAEAGLQYARRFFGQNYEGSHQWNDYLDLTTAGYRYDPEHFPSDVPDLAHRPAQTRGKSDGATFDPGADLDGDGRPDFWVSIRDDDDEAPLGAADSRTRDNNETVILRSECTNEAWSYEEGGQRRHAIVEALLTHVQGASGYGNAQITSNSPDVVGQH
jgi:hypothetical protein